MTSTIVISAFPKLLYKESAAVISSIYKGKTEGQRVLCDFQSHTATSRGAKGWALQIAAKPGLWMSKLPTQAYY